jgi:uncharacterized protein YegL
MKSNYMHLVLVVDRSGSMQRIRADMEGALTAYFDTQKLDAGQTTVSLYQFDNTSECVYAFKPLKDVEQVVIVPRGSTALYDAMAQAISETGKALSVMAEDDRPERVLVVTITDGEENSSFNATRQQVFEAVKHQTDTYGWGFVYLGANQDAMAAGGAIGVASASTYTYAPNSAGMRNMSRALSVTSSAFRTTGKANIAADDYQAP